MARTLPDPAAIDPWADEQRPCAIRLSPEQSQEAVAQARRNRRAYERHRDGDLQWVRNARLSIGAGVSLVDLSSGGALLDAPVPLRPASVLTLELVGAGFDTVVPFRVLRCQVGSIGAGGTIYRGACEFTQLIDLPGVRRGGLRGVSPGAFIGLDFALKHLVERAGPSGDIRLHDTDLVRQALQALQGRALRLPLDPIGNPLAALLARIVPALEHYQGLASVLGEIESELRRTVPQASLRLTGLAEAESARVKSILINVPGAAEASSLVCIDIPRGVVLNAWQSRLLRVTTRLIALLQRLEPERVVAPVLALVPPPAQVRSPAPTDPRDSGQATQWQKVVVRYAEGQILKGYTQDFSSTRSQFSLWPSISAAANERIIVPLACLKGVFFVRDFAGNPGYVERTDVTHTQHGRPIEVTLVDDEVIVGRTLSYRPDGYGFFVVPADPLANNIRVFVVSSAVRQVRFP